VSPAVRLDRLPVNSSSDAQQQMRAVPRCQLTQEAEHRFVNNKEQMPRQGSFFRELLRVRFTLLLPTNIPKTDA